MSTFQPNIPTGSVNLDQDYLNLQGNNQQLDTSFGTNHYKFSDGSSAPNGTPNNGKHTTIQSPLLSPAVHPTTPADECAFYSMKDSTPVGTIHYSRGPSDAVPSPQTFLQSGSSPIVLLTGTYTPVLDFTGLPRAFATLYAANLDTSIAAFTLATDIYWTGTTFIGALPTRIIVTGNTINILNTTPFTTANNIYWTLVMYRLS